MPMSASVRVNKDEVLELLDDAVSRLPDELRSARWLLKEREEFLARSRRDGEELIADAKSRVAHMVQRTEVVKAAELRARQIVEDAEAVGPSHAPRDRGLLRPEAGQLRERAGPDPARRSLRVAAGWPLPPSRRPSWASARTSPTGATAVPVFDQDLMRRRRWDRTSGRSALSRMPELRDRCVGAPSPARQPPARRPAGAARRAGDHAPPRCRRRARRTST